MGDGSLYLLTFKKKEGEELATPQAPDLEASIVPYHHHYSVDIITLYVSLVLSSATSLRGAHRALSIVFGSNTPECEVPSWYSGRLWLLRLGYYKLTREKEKRSDWVWIVDHTLQLGSEKCLLILGFPLERWNGGTLTHEDVEPIALHPVTQSNGEIVYEQLEEAAQKTGVPRQIVKDRGSDLNAGVRKFQEGHSECASVYDIKHKAAAILKRELSKDEEWVAFSRYAAQVRREVQQTSLAALAPPNQRTKARYMNVDKLIEWGGKILRFLEEPPASWDHLFTPEAVKAKFGTLVAYREALTRWTELLEVVEEAVRLVRERGLYRGAHNYLRNKLPFALESEQACRVREELIEHVRIEGAQARAGERLYGSSEVIESIFGKFKHIEQDQAKGGFTGLILALPAMVSKTTSSVVRKCMESISTSKVFEWCRSNLGQTVRAKRRLAFAGETKTGSE